MEKGQITWPNHTKNSIAHQRKVNQFKGQNKNANQTMFNGGPINRANHGPTHLTQYAITGFTPIFHLPPSLSNSPGPPLLPSFITRLSHPISLKFQKYQPRKVHTDNIHCDHHCKYYQWRFQRGFKGDPWSQVFFIRLVHLCHQGD